MAGQIFRQHAGSETGAPLRAFVCGTPFQVLVWRALLQVQPGALTSYGRLANSIGKPTASRAVGAAVGQNPLAYLIPCHRVIRETGVIGDYHWGSGPQARNDCLGRFTTIRRCFGDGQQMNG